MRRIAVISGLVLAGAAGPVARAADWTGTTGNWNVASNWNPANVPDTATETAAIASGTATLATGYTLAGLTLTGGTVTGPYGITTAALAWSGGTMSGAGITTVTGNATLSAPANAYLTVTGGRLLRLQGDTTLAATNGYGLLLSGGVDVQNTGNLTITNNASVNVGTGTNTFLNNGVIKKTGGTGSSTLYQLVNNDILTVQSGSLQAFLKNGGVSSGAFNATAGHTLTVSTSGLHTLNGAALSGDGTILLNGGTLFAYNTTTSTATDLRLIGTTLTGTYNFPNLTWSGGQLGDDSTATTVTVTNGTITAPTTTAIQNNLLLKKATLNLTGDVTVNGGGNGYLGVIVQTGSRINNSGTLRLTTGVSIAGNANVPVALANTGTIVKTGADTFNQIYSMTNTGQVQVQSGLLVCEFAGGVNDSGTYTVSTGATLHVYGYNPNSDGVNGSMTFGTNTAFRGQGTVQVFNSTVNFNGSVQAAGMTLNVRKILIEPYVDATINSVITNGTGTGATLGLTKTNDGTLLLANANTYTGPTNVEGGTLLTTAAAGNNILGNAGGLVFTGKPAKWVLNYTGGAVPVNPTNTIKAILTAGYANQFKTGQIRSTVTGPDLSLGYKDSGTAVTVAVALPGDANLDGTVSFNDFVLLQTNFGARLTRWDQGNFDYNNFTDFNDFVLLQTHFGQTINPEIFGRTGATAAEAAAMNAFAATLAMPEPAAASTLLAAGGLVARRRRR